MLDERLEDPDLHVYHADGAIMTRAVELRRLLAGRNPFNVHHDPETSAIYLR